MTQDNGMDRAEPEYEVPLLPLNDDVKWILGRPNFVCAPVATVLRMMGRDIAYKAEDEQAAVIHWYLTQYEEYGIDWRKIAKDKLQGAVDKYKEEIGNGG